MNHTFARRVYEAQATFSFEKILISLPILMKILRRIIVVNIYCIEFVATKPRVVFRSTEELGCVRRTSS